MCGIIGAVAQRDITEVLLEGLRRLEYRGYDSAGLAIVDKNKRLKRLRRVGKVSALIEAISSHPFFGETGIAHTRWATHGKPTESNAHPHVSGHVVVVHNGIIENYEILRQQLKEKGYIFVTQTDTEVIAHLTHWEHCKQGGTIFDVTKKITKILQGSYGAVIMDSRNPGVLVAARSGSPIVIGIGVGENFVSSDHLALLPITKRFIFLEEGDVAEVTRRTVQVWNQCCSNVERPEIESKLKCDISDKGTYRHYMKKEIFEQPQAIKNTMEDFFINRTIAFLELENNDCNLLREVQYIRVIACGTSYHSAVVSRYWFESLAGIPCDVEIASEFRYRKVAIHPYTLLITLSQSGETADTLAALRVTKKSLGYFSSLAICNVADSSLVRESDIKLMTRAGIEISVASTKTFTSQLTILLMLAVRLARLRGMSIAIEEHIVRALTDLPSLVEQILEMDNLIERLAENFYEKCHVLFLGRGSLYPIAMEGALKLKEISYIHAEAYAAGELKHGPLALVDAEMPVVVIAVNNDCLKKLQSNIEEVRARGGQLCVFSDREACLTDKKNMKIVPLPHVEEVVAPIVYAIPMQLLAYHTAVLKGVNVDQPRNLAKSVTVE